SSVLSSTVALSRAPDCFARSSCLIESAISLARTARESSMLSAMLRPTIPVPLLYYRSPAKEFGSREVRPAIGFCEVVMSCDPKAIPSEERDGLCGNREALIPDRSDFLIAQPPARITGGGAPIAVRW